MFHSLAVRRIKEDWNKKSLTSRLEKSNCASGWKRNKIPKKGNCQSEFCGKETIIMTIGSCRPAMSKRLQMWGFGGISLMAFRWTRLGAASEAPLHTWPQYSSVGRILILYKRGWIRTKNRPAWDGKLTLEAGLEDHKEIEKKSKYGYEILMNIRIHRKQLREIPFTQTEMVRSLRKQNPPYECPVVPKRG